MQWESAHRLAQSFRGGVISVGKFDGVHKGHAAILHRVKELGLQQARPTLALTFDHHPASILHPERIPPTLCTFQRKADLIDDYQLDALVLIQTNMDFLDLSPEEFFQSYILEKIGAACVVEGESFTFGKNRVGNADLLKTLCEESSIEVEIVPPVMVGEQAVSSSRIRKFICEGEIEAANAMLTRPFRVTGKVVHGLHRGTGLGFPTANLSEIRTIIPKDGVYACVAQCEGKSYPATTSIGENSTFDEHARKIEAHLIGCDETLYDKTMHLDFIARIRDMQRFDSPEELVTNIRSDLEKTKEILENVTV